MPIRDSVVRSVIGKPGSKALQALTNYSLQSKREWIEYQDDDEIKDGTYKQSFKLDILTGNLFACPPFLNHGGESGNHSSSGGGGVDASLVNFFFSSSKPTSTIPSRSRSAH